MLSLLVVGIGSGEGIPAQVGEHGEHSGAALCTSRWKELPFYISQSSKEKEGNLAHFGSSAIRLGLERNGFKSHFERGGRTYRRRGGCRRRSAGRRRGGRWQRATSRMYCMAATRLQSTAHWSAWYPHCRARRRTGPPPPPAAASSPDRRRSLRCTRRSSVPRPRRPPPPHHPRWEGPWTPPR